jgi:transcriptional regulator with XRE-family HTH domain
MPRYVKDEINFHKFLDAMRQLHEVTLEQACEGLCSASMMKRIERGDRLPEKQMRDRIMARMGVPIEGYEDYLSTEEYEQWELRQKFLKSIENKQIAEAEEYLEAYRVYEKQNAVEAQYCDAMELMVLQMKNAPIEKQQAVVEHAVGLTIPKIEDGLSEKTLLSEQELNLLMEYVGLREYSGNPEVEFEWRCKQYQEILHYIEHSHLDKFCRAKVYPKVAYYLSELILHKAKTEENLKLGIRRCNESIELLRDSRKLYYLVELVEVLERLVKEYGFFLRKANRREEIEKLQADLQEKKEWRDVIMELYTEHQVSPYMEHFCHLYWEMESYCIGDVIRIRRQMFGMTKEQLCEGICSVKTLTRIEHKKVKTQMPIVRELFERLGLCAEYIRARVITSDYSLLKLAGEMVWYENNRKSAEWERCLKELEEQLCLDIPQNKQFVVYSRYLSRLVKKEISQDEFINKLIEIIEYTIPLDYVMKEGDKFLSQEEYTYIRAIGMRAEKELASRCMETISGLCQKMEPTGGHMKKYEFLMTSVISYLGNIGEYEESDSLGIKLARQSLTYRRSYVLAETIYSNLWNKQNAIIEEGKSIDEEYKKIIKDCILLGKYNKNEKEKTFFERKLEE